MIDVPVLDLRPYPRTEPCVICGVTPVDVVSPGDTWGQVCRWCDAALYAEARRYPDPTWRELFAMEDLHRQTAPEVPS